MTSPLTVKDRFPRKDFASVTQIGLKAIDLAAAHLADVKARLPAGMLDGLAADVEALGAAVSGARQVRNEARSATAAQRVALQEGGARVRAIRTAVRKATRAMDVRRAYGVGQKMYVESVRDVKAALQQIIDRAQSNAAEAKAFGVLAADVAALKKAVLAISEADSAQEKQRAAAPLATKARNRTANRVVEAAKRVASAGLIAFAGRPVEQARFEELMRGTESRRHSASRRTGADPPPA